MEDHQIDNSSANLMCKSCVLIADLPQNIENRLLCENLNAKKAVIIPSPNGDPRDNKWLVQFLCADEAERFIQQSTTVIQIEGTDIPVKIEKPTPCDIPPQWIELQHKDVLPRNQFGTTAQDFATDSGAVAQLPATHHGTIALLPAINPGAIAQLPATNSGATAQLPATNPGATAKLPDQFAYPYGPPGQQMPHRYYPYPRYTYPVMFYPPYDIGQYPKPPDGAAGGRGPPPPYNMAQVAPIAHYEGSSMNAPQYGIPSLHSASDSSLSIDEYGSQTFTVSKGSTKMNKDGKKSTTVIKVSELPEGATEDALTLFFENRRKFGGGNIESCSIDETNGTAFITFEEPEAVERVLEKLPILFMDKKIEVSACYPESTENSDDEEGGEIGGEVTPTLNRIEVKGVKPGTSDDTVLYYFENKRRSGGGDIQNLEREDDVIYITFEDENIIDRVLAKQHKIDGALLQVSRHIPAPPPKPRPTYTDKFFISGLNPDTTRDCLLMYIEARVRHCPTELIYGEQEGTALIIFEEETPEFEKLESVFANRPLDGHTLSVAKVPVTNTVMVTGINSTTSSDTVRFYFENRRRSGGGEVEDVQLEGQEGTCFVSFKDPEIIYDVCGRSHKIDGQELNAQIYYECLGKASITSNTEGNTKPKFKIPESFTVKDDADGKKIQFLHKTKKVCQELEKNMESCYASIEWSEGTSCYLTLHCTLTTDVDNHRKLAKSWKKQVNDVLNRFMDRLTVNRQSVMLEAWDRIIEGLKSMNITHPDGVVVSVEKEQREIIMTGFKAIVNSVSKQVADLIEKANRELERLKQETNDSQVLPYHKIHLLKEKKYLESMKTKYPNLKINFNMKKLQIDFEGLVTEINLAKVAMFEMLQNISKSVVGKFSPEKVKFLESESITDYLLKSFEDKQVCGVWEISQDGTVTMYSLSDKEGVKAVHFMKETLVETPISFKPESLELLQSPKWANKKAEIENKYPGLVHMVPCLDQQQIIILSVDEIAGQVREFVDDFITFYTVFTEVLPLPPGKQRYLQEYHKKDFEALSREHKDEQGQAKVIDGKIQLKGTRQSMKHVKKGVQDILDKVEHRQHVFKKPGIVKYIKSEQGKEKIQTVEKMQRCVIEANEHEKIEMDNEDEAGFEDDQPPRETEMGNVVTSTGQRIFAVCGDITELPGIDVIVNAANKQLDHMGGLAKVIVNKGGQSIQDECFANVRRYPLCEGDLFCGKPGKLNCKAIFHAVGPIYQYGKNKEDELLREVVLKALEEMEKRQFHSIAFPALCSGVFGFPVTLATKVIVESLKHYFKTDPRSIIKDIYLCDVQVGNVQFFFQAMKKAFGSDKVHGKIQDPRTLAGLSASGKQKGATRSSGGHVKQEADTGCNISIEVVEGLISKEKVDVIVNTTSRDLQLNNGAVSSSLLKAGGPGLQKECSSKYPNGIKPGDVAVTSGGRLKCQSVFHGALKEWSTAAGSKSLEIYRGFINKCLVQADSDGHMNIAFPALGTGNLGFPKDIAAREMFQSVTDFSISHPACNITEVRFVVFDKDIACVKAFRSEEKRWKSGGARQGRKFSSDTVAAANARGGATGQSEDMEESLLQIGSLKLRVYQGDITQAQTDVIVNTTNSDFELTRGAVAKAVAKAGGDFLMRQIAVQSKPLKFIAVTSASPTMNCKFIIHLNAEDISKKWKTPILKILERSDELGCTSVAFPALGTGYAKSNAISDVAEGLWEALLKVKDNLKTVEEVHMVIFDLDKLKDFISEMHTHISKEVSKSPGKLKRLQGFLGIGDPVIEQKEKAKVFKVLQPEVSSIILMIYANSQTSIEDAIEAIDKQCEKDFTTKVIEDEMIKEFTQSHVNQIKDLERGYGVNIILEIRIGRLRIHGPIQNVLDAATPAHNIIQAALKNRQAKEEAVLVSDLVQWFFIEITNKGNNLVPYPSNVNLILEKAYRDQKPEASFCDSDETKYIVDLNSYVEYPAKDPSDKVEVIRRDLMKDTKNEIPSNWTPMKNVENVSVVTLSPSDNEYTKVVQNFNQTASGNYNIVKVERIQNRMLYQQYLAKKNLMESQNTSGHQNENTLWHGTSAPAVDSINTYGFNRSYCGRNATVYGNGVYFAVSSDYSARDQYAAPDHKGDKRIYQCKVLTGEYVQGSQGLRVPPQKLKHAGAMQKQLARQLAALVQPASGPVTHYDSVVDNTKNPGIYVIFNDTQAYPEYLITFN